MRERERERERTYPLWKKNRTVLVVVLVVVLRVLANEKKKKKKGRVTDQREGTGLRTHWATVDLHLEIQAHFVTIVGSLSFCIHKFSLAPHTNKNILCCLLSSFFRVHNQIRSGKYDLLINWS